MKARLLIITVFAGVLGLLGLVGYYRAPVVVSGANLKAIQPAAVRVARLTERDYALTESFYGLIEANSRVDMAFQIVGRIQQLGRRKGKPLTENQVVREGELIARLKPDRYEAAVEQAKATKAIAKAAMSTASADIAQVNAELQDAKSELLRLQQLKYRDATTTREVEKAELRVKVARAGLDRARANAAVAQASYRSALAEGKMAGVNLQDTVLRAPLKATVAAVPVEIGQMVSPGQSAVTLVDLSKVKLVIGVVERKVPLLREGQKVSVDILALSSQVDLLSDSRSVGEARRGVIAMVPPVADDQTGLFNVEIELKNGDGLLLPGMIGKATVEILKQRGIAVPASASVRRGDRAWAYFVSRGYRAGLKLGGVGSATVGVPAAVAKRVWFDPVIFDKEYYMVTSMPEELDQIIVEGHSRLHDGQTVKVIDALVSRPTVPGR